MSFREDEIAGQYFQIKPVNDMLIDNTNQMNERQFEVAIDYFRRIGAGGQKHKGFDLLTEVGERLKRLLFDNVYISDYWYDSEVSIVEYGSDDDYGFFSLTFLCRISEES